MDDKMPFGRWNPRRREPSVYASLMGVNGCSGNRLIDVNWAAPAFGCPSYAAPAVTPSARTGSGRVAVRGSTPRVRGADPARSMAALLAPGTKRNRGVRPE